MTCMYPPPHMTCMYPAFLDMYPPPSFLTGSPRPSSSRSRHWHCGGGYLHCGGGYTGTSHGGKQCTLWRRIHAWHVKWRQAVYIVHCDCSPSIPPSSTPSLPSAPPPLMSPLPSLLPHSPATCFSTTTTTSSSCSARGPRRSRVQTMRQCCWRFAGVAAQRRPVFVGH